MKKYVLTENYKINVFGVKLFQIKAVRSFAYIDEGELGGFVEKEDNLDHDGNAWVHGNAEVYGDARVHGNAEVYGDARVYGNADYCCFLGFGSCNRNTTMFRDKNNNVMVSCGCFFGTLDEFSAKVQKIHGDSLFGREYKSIVQVARIHFGLEKEVKDGEC